LKDRHTFGDHMYGIIKFFYKPLPFKRNANVLYQLTQYQRAIIFITCTMWNLISYIR